ncbi:MAG: cytochrome c maturation protein CcmE [Halobacteriales archaeon]|nr:cytochrome c maturation protein CcmE [Halobacteriales archaeon]
MRRRTRLLLLLAVGMAGAGIAVAGVLPEGFASVSEVVHDPGAHAGHELHVKAIVAAHSLERGNGTGVRFAVTDDAATLPVVYDGSVPDSFAEGRTVVVSGLLEPAGPGWVLHATGIQGGCASKYEPAVGG